MQMFRDISINVCSDFLFIGILLSLLFLVRRKDLEQAKRFFGFGVGKTIEIYVSGHEDKQTTSKRVVTAVEYEAAVQVKQHLQHISGSKFAHRLEDFIARLIGQDTERLEPAIKVSPLEELTDTPSSNSLILIGGPLRNQVTKFYLDAASPPLIRFDPQKNKYIECLENQEREIDEFGNVAILEKILVDQQVAIIAFGTGESHTQIAVQYLLEKWKSLNKSYLGRSFAVILLTDSNGNVEMERFI